ncbi:MAG: hypothetical protein WAN51_00455, partial [Alphaproteobacteria bacterium]
TFPVGQLTTATPLFYIDSPFHWYQMEAAKAFAAAGRVVGYDPYFAAGYWGGVNINASAKFPALLSILLSPRLSSVVVYKLYVFAAAVLAPACIPFAARWLRLSVRAGLAATIFGVLVWWLSAMRWYHTVGMASFVFTSYLALPLAALTIRYLTEPTTRLVPLAIVIVGVLGMFIHPLFPLLVAFIVVALMAAQWQYIDRKKLPIVLVAFPLLCVLPNLMWIMPTLHSRALGIFAGEPYQKAVDISIIWQEALGQFTKHARGAHLNTVLWFGALWACAAPLESAAKRVAIALTAAAAALILFAALGAALPFVATLQPNRFSGPAYLLLSIPAGLGLTATINLFSSRGLWRLAAMGSSIVFVAAFGFLTWELERELSYADIPHHGVRPPEVGGIGADSVWILSWLKTHTTSDSRVLFESSGGRIHDNAHMAGYYALTADREFIGGPYPYMQFAGFWDGFLFGKPIDTISREEFADYLRLYNIGSIIVFSDVSKRYLDGQPGFTRGEAFGPLQTYQVDGPRSFFLAGSGTVVARTFNRLEFAQLSGPEIILKYHYVPGLETDPPADIGPVSVPGDPTPFIRILNPPPHLVLNVR